jgi:putative transposase
VKRHFVTLTDKQRQFLTSFTRTGKHPAQAITRARILLQADTNGPNHQHARIAENLDVQIFTVERICKKFCKQGLEATLHRKARKDKGQPVKIDGRVEAQIIKIACSNTPNGEPEWTLRMIADELVNLEFVESIARESVRRTLKKTSLNRT